MTPIDMTITSTTAPTIRGLPLRRLLTTILADDRGTLDVAELARRCEMVGVEWGDRRASKVISDALRWEIGWGRVGRAGRGRYRFVGAPRTTMRRIRVQADAIRAILAAMGHDTGT